MPKTAKFSEYYFYFNKTIYGDFQICINVALKFRKTWYVKEKVSQLKNNQES